MNRNGQTLILFVLLIPLLLIFAALIIDIGLLAGEKSKANNTVNIMLKEYYEKKEEGNIEEKIKEGFEKNGLPTANLIIKKGNNYLEMQIDYEIESIFGKIIGIKNYPISIRKKIVEENDKKVIE